MNNRISFDKDTPWEREIGDEKTNFRFNIITMLVYIIGIVLIVQLFNLQVVNGETYREQLVQYRKQEDQFMIGQEMN